MKVIDPLAQSFYIENETGAFITSVDLYFLSKDAVLPITVQLRPMEMGLPTPRVYPFSEIVVDPKDINISEDASIPTRITFPSPVYLVGRKFHALVLMSNIPTYNVWVSRLGEVDVTTLSGPESKQILVTKQPLSGGLFKSQNASTWNESPYEDLKFTLYRADFTSQAGDFNFYNPELSLGNKQVATLVPNPLDFESNIIRVGLGTTIQDSNLKLGNTIVQQGSNASGNYVFSAGSASGNLTIINSGIGYTPSAGGLTYTGVAVTSINGSGKNATANITIENGVAVAATISNGGTGFTIGEVLTVSELGVENTGTNLLLSVSNLSGVNELVLDNVQGQFVSGAGKTMQYITSAGVRTDINSNIGGGVLISDGAIETRTDGLHIRVNHRNHGMHDEENVVKISNVLPDIKPIKLTSDYDQNSTGDLLVTGTTNFSTFENVGVSSTNPGYVLIGNEILAYQGVTENTLTGVTRGIDQTLAFSYSQGTQVYKYELNGISLRRINTTHTLQDALVKDASDFDYYTIKVNMSSAGKTLLLPYGQVDRSVGTSFPLLRINETKSTGGMFVNATQNIQFEMAKPNIQTMILNGTDITARVRTIAGTSIDGFEYSFEDQGFDNMELDRNNYFDSPRIVCSKVNEDERLADLPGKKSLTVNLFLETTDPYLSPVVDLDRASMIFVTNRINNPIVDYDKDERVATLDKDPSSFVYATNTIQLEIPATSLKVMVAAYVNQYSDLRCLYSIKKDPNDQSIYYPFPGYSNQATDPDEFFAGGDGTPDEKTPKSDIMKFESSELDFRDYEFTIANLPEFRYFSIKLIGAGTNQAFPPRLKDLRVISLA